MLARLLPPPLVRCLAVVACCATAIPSSAQSYSKLSPFTRVECRGLRARVEYDGRAYELRSIDGLSTRKILEFCRKTYADNWEKRFAEDLVEVMSEIGKPPGTTVRLELVDRKTRDASVVERAEMTNDNRERVRRARAGQRGERREDDNDFPRALDEFSRALRRSWSYYRANGADFDGAIAALRKRVDEGIGLEEFSRGLTEILALGIDGHASVESARTRDDGFLPFLVEPVGEKFVAFLPDRSAFVDSQYPYVSRIDGRTVEEWCSGAASVVPKGSPQYVRRHALRELRRLAHWRARLGDSSSSTVRVELRSARGKRRRIELPIARRFPAYGTWPRTESRELPGKIGYLRIRAMDETAIAEIEEWMPRFRNTRGLVVDVRDNGGGSREALRLFFSYLVSPRDKPRVANCAAYRLDPSLPEDHLKHRFLYRVNDERWNAAERAAIKTFASRFKPDWELPTGEFSEFHYLVLGRLDRPGVYHYRRPVVVLTNEKCFSATDIFLAGLKGWRGVTLVGTPSGGGSAFTTRIPLSGSPLDVRLGTMASFQVDGKLFDGNGVAPDVRVEPSPEYFLGRNDPVLERAIRIIRSGR